jgi:hypothetical protein
MNDTPRSARVSVSLPPELLARLERFAAAHHWKASTAAWVLIERGLEVEEQKDQADQARGRKARTR